MTYPKIDRQTDRQIDRQIDRYMYRQKIKGDINTTKCHFVRLLYAHFTHTQVQGIDRQIDRYIDRQIDK